MKITLKWLREKGACSESIELWKEREMKSIDGKELVKKLMKEKRLSWANWLIVQLMKYKQYVKYAVYAAEQVIKIFEDKYPDDKRPRKAIQAAKKCIKNPSKKNKDAADAADAACAADAAADAADAADAAYVAGIKIKILKYGLRLLKQGE